MKVGLHQVSVLSTLLFAVVSSDARNGISSELLCADDLVPMAPTIWSSLIDVYLNGKLSFMAKDEGECGKSKVMVRNSGGNKIVCSGKWPCGKVVQINSVKYTVCKK